MRESREEGKEGSDEAEGGRKGEGIGWDGGPRCRSVKRWPKQKGKLNKK